MNAIEEHLQQQILALEARVKAFEKVVERLKEALNPMVTSIFSPCPQCGGLNSDCRPGFAYTCPNCGKRYVP